MQKGSYILVACFLLFLACTTESCKEDDEEPEICMTDTGKVVLPPTPYDFKLGDQFSTIDAVYDNTTEANPTTDQGAELGRFLFYDQRLSKNNTIACASCHHQDKGFSDPEQFSTGFEGEKTPRHSMSLVNLRWSATIFLGWPSSYFRRTGTNAHSRSY